MKLNKKYYQYLIEEMAKKLLKQKNGLAQMFYTQIKMYKTHSIGYSTDDLDIIITIKERKY